MLIRADARKIPLRDKIAQSCVCSPPYWGLRSYSVPALIFDGDLNCQHNWTDRLPHGRRGNRGISGTGGNLHPSLDASGRGAGSGGGGGFCALCGAWRGQLGLEPNPDLYVRHLVDIFREIRRVLRNDGTAWLVIGDTFAGSRSYQSPEMRLGSARADGIVTDESPRNRDGALCPPGLKPKDLCGIPWRVAFALQEDGWYLRSDIIWSKPNPMPESVKDRPTRAHEYVFLLTKNKDYFYDADAIAEEKECWRARGQGRIKENPDRNDNGDMRDFANKDLERGVRNKRSVWEVPTEAFSGWQQISRLVRVERDAVCDGSLHIVSPNCQAHAGLLDLVSSALYGEREDDWLSRIERSGNHLALEQRSGFVRVGPLRAYYFDGQNLDSILRQSGWLATGHSNQNRRMDLVLWTDLAYKLSDEILSRIERILRERGLSVQDRGRLLSSTSPDEMDVRLLERTISRTVGRSWEVVPSCRCGLYDRITEKESHYATFPRALIEPMILAGTRPGDIVIDPFSGSGTVVMTSRDLGCIGIGLDLAYQDLASNRIYGPLFAKTINA